MPTDRTIKTLPDASALNQAAAEEFCRCAFAAIAAQGRFAVALSGGSTPRSVYALLAEWDRSGARRLEWDRIFIFFGDERHVPPAHPDSNYRMANEALLSLVPIPPQNVCRIQAELDANTAAQQYEDQLRQFFGLRPGEWPRFDLIMLGLGDDGHTASLFPGSAALEENQHLVIANWIQKFQQYRITLTFPVLNHAAQVLFLASGKGKAQILREVLHGEGVVYPSQRVRPENGGLLWLVDQEAAKLQ